MFVNLPKDGLINCFYKKQLLCYSGSKKNKQLEDFLTKNKIKFEIIELESITPRFEECGILFIDNQETLTHIHQVDDPHFTNIWLIVYDDCLADAEKSLKDFAALPLSKFLHNDIGLEQLQFNGQKVYQKKLLSHTFSVDEYMQRLKLGTYSSVFNQMEDLIGRIASTNAPTLIYGETGTGKELVARALHQMSPRSSGPFIPINCGALTDDIALSELFGHEKGSFTGAASKHTGLIELADGGTLFLDEINSLSPKVQVSLLRYMQDGELRRVGGKNLIKTDVRIISATNADLNKDLKSGSFREDLLFRIDMMHIDLPPLNQRGYDVIYLAQYFLSKLSLEFNQATKVLAQKVNQWLLSYDFPGNVRELENIISRAFFLSSSSVIEFEDLHLSDSLKNINILDSVNLRLGYKEAKTKVLNDFEKTYLHQIMKTTNGNISKAASLANKERRTFTRLLEKHHIKKSQYNQR
ncbi:sigma-54 interaction domain-containing protein [Aliikangiella coralliicola]|uniref:Sigma-54-dependent Fis family transcriptional regulator n=1 Tax=Aliikangiella coralliicola TaxID=2592383 RepID=A0A545UCS9_9GAMM|nr:sigma-54 dependent transcriptional regulator [Aliikangiella coralliicola]TQV87272.1 sigma-54-dependent Fis family transcriptional regulator [Aliikangiella coralliicola]